MTCYCGWDGDDHDGCTCFDYRGDDVKWALDLCSGLGGASEAFCHSPHWRVIRVENNEKLAHVPHTWILDVKDWKNWLPAMLAEYGPPYLIIAAPPCTEFSRGYNAPREIARREGWDYNPDMSIFNACLEIIEECQSHGNHWWVLENVIGAIPDFSPQLGDPRQIIGPFVLWGVFPHLPLDSREFRAHKAGQDVWSSDPLRANKKAKWPIEVSQELLDAINYQQTLSYWS